MTASRPATGPRASRHARPLLLALTLALTACGGDDDGNGGGDGGGADAGGTPDAAAETVEEMRTLVAGDLIEGTWDAGPDDRIVVELEATAPFAWNIHGHDGDDTITIVEDLDRTEASHDFDPPGEGPWNLTVVNQGDEALDVTVRMQLYGDASWLGWAN